MLFLNDLNDSQPHNCNFLHDCYKIHNANPSKAVKRVISICHFKKVISIFLRLKLIFFNNKKTVNTIITKRKNTTHSNLLNTFENYFKKGKYPVANKSSILLAKYWIFASPRRRLKLGDVNFFEVSKY